jgi:predicted RNase H-like HicB family nuclease
MFSRPGGRGIEPRQPVGPLVHGSVTSAPHVSNLNVSANFEQAARAESARLLRARGRAVVPGGELGVLLGHGFELCGDRRVTSCRLRRIGRAAIARSTRLPSAVTPSTPCRFQRSGWTGSTSRKSSVVIERDEHGYCVWCPQLKGFQSQGATLEQAIANIKETIQLYLETLPDEEHAWIAAGFSWWRSAR